MVGAANTLVEAASDQCRCRHDFLHQMSGLGCRFWTCATMLGRGGGVVLSPQRLGSEPAASGHSDATGS